jgi:signal transduction histidine kinase
MFHNVEIKKFTYLYIVSVIIFFIITLVGCNIIINKIDQEYKNLAFDLVQESYANLDEKSKTKVIDELEKKGFKDFNASDYAKGKLTSLKDLKIFICSMVIVIMILTYIVVIIFIKRLYKKIRNISKETEKVVKKDYDINLEDYLQGDFGLLTSNFKEMVRVIRESEEREQKKNLFLKDLISDISHQLKTPLSSLKVFNEILLDNLTKTEEDKTKVLEESKNQLNRIEWLVLSLLKLARIEAGTIIFNIQELSVYETILQTIEILRIKVEEKNLSVNLICDKDIIMLHDREWLSEALINIINNAIEYTDEGGKIEITVEKTIVFTRINIKDNGIGIDEKEIMKIFKRFYRVNNGVNPNSVGIGLSLSKRIIEGQGGTITVKSKKNEYTCFTITFINSLSN